MELANQIKKYRKMLNLSQDEFAEKIYVTRQTVSNWENEKNYPDIHSILRMATLFDISLDQLIKGDIEIMRKEINNVDLKKFKRDGSTLAALYVSVLLAAYPLIHFLGILGGVILGGIAATMLIFSIKVEKQKKQHNIQTFKDITAFFDGVPLDEIERENETVGNAKITFIKMLAGAVMGGTVVLLFWLIFDFLGI